MQCGHILGEAAQDHDHGGTVIRGAGPDRASEDLEDRATASTAIFDQGCAFAIMGGLAFGQRMSLGPVESLWVEGLQEKPVALPYPASARCLPLAR